VWCLARTCSRCLLRASSLLARWFPDIPSLTVVAGMLLASAPLQRVIASQIGDLEALINGLDD
jgi:hypothetical protein